MHLLPASTGAHINACNSSNLGMALVFGACAVSEMESRRAHMQMSRRADSTHVHYPAVADFTLPFNSISDIKSRRFIRLVSSLQNIYRYISITLTFRLLGPDY